LVAPGEALFEQLRKMFVHGNSLFELQCETAGHGEALVELLGKTIAPGGFLIAAQKEMGVVALNIGHGLSAWRTLAHALLGDGIEAIWPGHQHYWAS
jgi:hypothetical protein